MKTIKITAHSLPDYPYSAEIVGQPETRSRGQTEAAAIGGLFQKVASGLGFTFERSDDKFTKEHFQELEESRRPARFVSPR